VHGWVYAISNGLIMDLNVTVSAPDDDNAAVRTTSAG